MQQAQCTTTATTQQQVTTQPNPKGWVVYSTSIPLRELMQV